MLVGSVTGPIYDAGYVHHLLIGGSLLSVFGQMMLSLCTKYWQVFLAQGICIGVGAGCLFVPAVAILSTYFSSKIATATGIAAAGSSLGGVIYPIVFYRLQPTIGFPWATRVLAFMMLATLGLSNCVMRVRVLPAGRRKFFDLTAFTEAPYLLFVFGGFLAFMGLYAPFFYVQSYAIDTKIASPELSFYLLSIINALSTFGRIIPGYIATHIGPLSKYDGGQNLCTCLRRSLTLVPFAFRYDYPLLHAYRSAVSSLDGSALDWRSDCDYRSLRSLLRNLGLPTTDHLCPFDEEPSSNRNANGDGICDHLRRPPGWHSNCWRYTECYRQL